MSGTSAVPFGRSHKNVQGDGGAGTGQLVDLTGVGEAFVNSGGGGTLYKLAEARAGIRKSPGRKFDAEAVQRSENAICFRMNFATCPFAIM